MAIIVTCANGHKLRVKDEHAGKKVRCPNCKSVVQVPVGTAKQAGDDLYAGLMGSDPGATPPPRSAPARRPAAASQPVRRRTPTGASGARAKANSAPWKLPLAIAGALAAVAALVVVAVIVLGGGDDQVAKQNDVTENRSSAQMASGEDPAGRSAANNQTQQPMAPRGNSPSTVAGTALAVPPDIPHEPIDLTYLPPEAELIVSLRLGALLGTPLLQPLLASQGPPGQNPLAEFEQQLGIGLADVDSVVIAMPTLEEAISAGMSQAGGMPGLPGPGPAPGAPPEQSAQEEPPAIAVVRTSKPFDSQKLLAAAGDSQPQQLGEVTYYLIQPPDMALPGGGLPGLPMPRGAGGPGRSNPFGPTQGAGLPPGGPRGGAGLDNSSGGNQLSGQLGPGTTPPAQSGQTFAQGGQTQLEGAVPQAEPAEETPIALHFPDNQTIVLGTEELVRRAIEQTQTPAARPELASFNAGHHVLIAIAPEGGLGAAAQGAPMPVDENDPLAQAIGHASAVAFSAIVTDHVFLFATLPCNDAPGAAQLQAALDGTIQQLQAAYAGMKPSISSTLGDVLDVVVGSVAVSQDDAVVQIAATLPPRMFEPQTIAVIPALMMGGAFGMDTGEMEITPDMTEAGPGEFSVGQFGQDEPPVAAKVIEDGWEKTLNLSYEKPQDLRVRLEGEAFFATIELTGVSAQSATAYGMLRVDSATDDRGNELKLIAPRETTGLQGDPSKQFLPVNYPNFLSGRPNPPDNRVRIHLMLESPLPAAKQLATLEGSVQVAQHKEIILRGNLNKPGTKLADPALEEAGLFVQIGRDVKVANVDPSMIVVVQATGATAKLLVIRLADDSGQSLSSGVGRSQSGGTTTYTLLAQQELPPGVSLKVSLVDEETLVEVPFKFENVALPPRP